MGDWSKAFKEGQKLRARVLYVDSTAKTIALSLLPHLLKMTTTKLPEVGSLIKVGFRVSATAALLTFSYRASLCSFLCFLVLFYIPQREGTPKR